MVRSFGDKILLVDETSVCVHNDIVEHREPLMEIPSIPTKAQLQK